jgi:hypothetical protein
VRRKIDENSYIFYTDFKRTLLYFIPLIGFFLAIPALSYNNAFDQLLIYVLGFFWIFSFGLAAAIKPRIRVNPVHLIIYHTRRAHITNVYIDDIKKIDSYKKQLVIISKAGQSILLPKISPRDRRVLLQHFALFNIEIEAVPF